MLRFAPLSFAVTFLLASGSGKPSKPLAIAGAADPPSCRADLDGMAHAIEADYAGFTLEVIGGRRDAYQHQLTGLQRRADSASAANCLPVLIALTTWFDDPHLFVYQSNWLDTAETRVRVAHVEHRALDEAAARRYFDRTHALDPIEGIWYDGKARFAVVRDSSAPTAFVAVLLASDTSIWHAGDVRARFTRVGEDHYQATISSANFAVRHLDAHIRKRVLLTLAPGLWGKEYPVAVADAGLVDARDPHNPTIIARDGAVIVSVPSHDPAVGPLFDSLIKANAEALRNTQTLVVDLRGNEGGSAGMTDALMPYIASAHEPPDPLDFRQSVMLSSPDQINYARNSFGSDTSAFVRSLVARLTAHPGGFVPVIDPATPPDSVTPDSVVNGPAHVGLMIDRGTVSAGEVIVVEARRSSRVTVFGEPTAGALDYQSVSVVQMNPSEYRWYLGYPTITANSAIPKGGIRGKGIQPDVRLDWSRLADPIGEVVRRLQRRN